MAQHVRITSPTGDYILDLPLTIEAVTEVPNDPPISFREQAPAIAVQLHGIWTNLGYWNGLLPTERLRAHLATIKDLGVNAVRVDFGWSSSQPMAGAPSLETSDNARLSALLHLLDLYHLDPFLTLWRTPLWTGVKDVAYFPPAAALTAWKSWCHWMAVNFGHRVMGFEIWNEPNLSAFSGIASSTSPDIATRMSADAINRAKAYMPVLEYAYDGIKTGNPSVKVIFGGPSKVDWLFIHECLRIDTALYDIMSVHPYQGNQNVAPTSILANYGTYLGYEKERMALGFPKLQSTLSAHDVEQRPLWCTEQGWSAHLNTAGVPNGVDGDEIEAGQYIRESAQFLKEKTDVRLHTVYCAYKIGDLHQVGFNLLTVDGVAKPNADALAQWIGEQVEDRPLW